MLMLVLTTCLPADAERLARVPVAERLAACCNRLPGILSTYHWEGKLTTDSEELLIFKAPREQVDGLMARLKELHPYKTPEIIALPVERANAAYLSWVRAEANSG